MPAFIKQLFKKETSSMIKQNVLVVCYTALLLVFIDIYHLLVGDYKALIPDAIILSLVGINWWLIKKHDTYYTNLVFILVVPFLLWVSYDAIMRLGAVGGYWSFTIIVLFYFCLPRRLAIYAGGLVLIVSVFASTKVMPTADGSVRLFFSLFMVILCCSLIFRKLHKQNLQLAEKAFKDKLTGAYNRTLLKENLEKAILFSKQQKWQNITTDKAETTTINNKTFKKIKTHLIPCVLCVDADHFKSVNDTYGHQKGDEVLVELSTTLDNMLTHKDDMLFRMGGEEFLILTYQPSETAVVDFAEAMRERVENLNILPNGKRITISIGVATIADYILQTNANLPAVTPEDLKNHVDMRESAKILYDDELTKRWNTWIKQADDAMYEAKRTGRNKVVLAKDLF